MEEEIVKSEVLEDSNKREFAEIVEREESDSIFIKSKNTVVYHIKDFDGPLDLLLTLINDSKIRIEDIFISSVTTQYLEIIKNTPPEEFDFEYCGEFITIAAELVYIKSFQTLPRDEEDELPEDVQVSEQDLINKLKEYKLMVEQSQRLKEIEQVNQFFRDPVFTEKDYRVSLIDFSLSKLVSAFAKVLANAEKRGHEVMPKKVVKERISVHDQMTNILQQIAVNQEMYFEELFLPDYDREDIVTTFLAVLELIKYGRITCNQDEVYSQITIYAVEGMDESPVTFDEGDDGKY